MPERDDWEAALRHAMRALPAPPVSADFDARVLAALARPQPWWRALWQQTRPLLSGACCSLVVTLALSAWSLRAPAPSGPPPAVASSPAAHPLDMTTVDRLLNRPRLSAAALSDWDAPPPAPADRSRTPTHPAEHAVRPQSRTWRTA